MRRFRRRRRLWRDKAGGEEKNLIKRRVERQKFFPYPPAIIQSSFTTQFLLNEIFQFPDFLIFVLMVMQ